MGHLNDHNPANTRAITCYILGFTHKTQIFRTRNYPHPSRGGTCGYPLWLHNAATSALGRNRSYIQSAQLIACSTPLIRWWERRIMLCRMTGGRQREQLIGQA